MASPRDDSGSAPHRPEDRAELKYSMKAGVAHQDS